MKLDDNIIIQQNNGLTMKTKKKKRIDKLLKIYQRQKEAHEHL
jgi:hypothetical protein